jgi:glycosyltransferase involved in cell wall biosynthesis
VTAETVSVVIPVRDGERHLGEAIESVLAQSRRPDEVVVVDDGSTDGTDAVARGFGPQVVVVLQPPLGVAPAVNRGVQEAQGTLLAFVDADDLWSPGKLELQLAALRDRPELEAVFGHAVQFGDGRPDAPPVPGYVRGTMLIRRAAFERIGPFADFRLGEFVEWYARAVDDGLATLLLPDVLLRRRIHDTNTGVRLRDEREEYTRMLKSVLDRRRAADLS